MSFIDLMFYIMLFGIIIFTIAILYNIKMMISRKLFDTFIKNNLNYRNSKKVALKTNRRNNIKKKK